MEQRSYADRRPPRQPPRLSWKTRRWRADPQTLRLAHHGLHRSDRQLQETGEDVYVPLTDLVPFVHVRIDLVIGGWDISGKNLLEASERAQVLEPHLIEQLAANLPSSSRFLRLRPRLYRHEPAGRADKRHQASNRAHAAAATLREDICDFKQKNGLDKVVVL